MVCFQFMAFQYKYSQARFSVSLSFCFSVINFQTHHCYAAFTFRSLKKLSKYFPERFQHFTFSSAMRRHSSLLSQPPCLFKLFRCRSSVVPLQGLFSFFFWSLILTNSSHAYFLFFFGKISMYGFPHGVK